MKYKYSIAEIRETEKSLNLNPSDSNLMNKLAIGYLNVPDAGGFNEVTKLLEKAYKIKPSIKTANNYAYQLITDWEEYEKGIKILKGYIQKIPNSHMPYNLIGYAQLMTQEYIEAITNFKISLNKKNEVDTIHNLAMANNLLDDNQNALALYNKICNMNDVDNRTLYNKAVTLIELKKFTEIHPLVERIKNSKEYNENPPWVSNLDLSVLYLSNDELEKAYELLSQDLNVWLSDSHELGYLLLKYNKSKFNELVENEIEHILDWIKDYQDPEDEEYKDMTEKEKSIEINELLVKIENIKRLEIKHATKPKINFKSLYQTVGCGCMLYDCKVHQNEYDD
jgi:predicted RNA-binding protein with EMAP domain